MAPNNKEDIPDDANEHCPVSQSYLKFDRMTNTSITTTTGT